MSELDTAWWSSLEHGGLLIAPARLPEFFADPLEPLTPALIAGLRRHIPMIVAGSGELGPFLDVVLEQLLGLDRASWQKASEVAPAFVRKALSGETLRPRRVWQGPRGELLPVFVPDTTRGEATRLERGRGRRASARVIEWLRATQHPIALLTNGRQWRLIHASADTDAHCEWDIEQWFEEGQPGPQVEALRRLLGRRSLTIRDTGEDRAPLVRAIQASRKVEAELSSVLGERVRQAVERLIQACSPALSEVVGSAPGQIPPRDAYLAATRMIMRLVVILFAEARELLPVGNPIYHEAYGLQGLREQLERSAAGRSERLRHRHGAWPRLLGLFALIHRGSAHEDITITRYGGGLFRPGTREGDGVARALHAFEHAHEHVSDDVVHRLIDLLTRSAVKVRQGRGSVWVDAPVDFSSLSSEYIGILYEGLLDYELRRADANDPMVFLDVGNQPALPFSRLDAMTAKQRKDLLDKLKAASKTKGEDGDEDEEDEDEGDDETDDDAEHAREAPRDADAGDDGDEARVWKEKVDTWARNALRDAGKVKRGTDFNDPELAAKAGDLVRRVVLPGEWFLVRWGGTRKGAGTFYTPPLLAGPTVRRTLQPLTHERVGDEWRPRAPETILALRVCDPAMGSGSFLVSALHWLTQALFESLHAHGRIAQHGHDAIVRLADGVVDNRPIVESLPLPPDHDDFESTLRARLKRYVVERCLYGVDIDPVAVELARLALWVDTMDRRLPFEFLDHKLACGNALVGCWFDRFESYPIVAWEREGGDAKHAGVHHHREVSKKKGGTELKGDRWTHAIKQRKGEIRDLLVALIHARVQPSFAGMRNDGKQPNRMLADARAQFEQLHANMTDPDQQERDYRAFRAGLAPLRDAFDAWCALWFWPGDALALAPTPQDLTTPTPEAAVIVSSLRDQHRFFHWEIEFPEVFTGPHAGFDALIGNPPWDIQKPNSKEFFSNVDPLYRSLGKQDALRRQLAMFEDSPALEREWIAYQARFKALSNWVAWAADPFGDPDNDPAGKGYSLDRKESASLHRLWRTMRGREPGFADPRHPFRHQGSADLNSYKLFVELGHALLRERGRMGMIVPSGLYTDKGTAALRSLLLEHCAWEWLFGFENREGIFGIHRSFKFVALVVEKGGASEATAAAFMRRKLEDWDQPQPRTIAYPRARVAQFSPESRAIVEVADERDLAVLEMLYENGVMLGEQGPRGWGIEYAREFDMTNDSKLFQPRPKWESQGYVPDEYGHWLAGPWRPFKGGKSILDRKPGLVLSRDGRQVLGVEDIEDVALPLYEGRMIGQFDFSEKGWVSGKGRSAKWRDLEFGAKVVEPQYLMGFKDCIGAVDKDGNAKVRWKNKVAFMDVTAATNVRTMISTMVRSRPCGNSVPVLATPHAIPLAALLNSIVYDYVARARCGGLHLNWFVIAESPLPEKSKWIFAAKAQGLALMAGNEAFASAWLNVERDVAWRKGWALRHAERLRRTCMIDALAAYCFNLGAEDLAWILRGCDASAELFDDDEFARTLNPKGFWRVDKDQPPELRHTVLAQVAFHDLQRLGLDEFLAQNDGEGWMLPETLRLADYGLGHDDRAKQHQPVATALGPRFFDWQLEQSVDESWAECERHAELIDQILPLPKAGQAPPPRVEPPPPSGEQTGFGFDEPAPAKPRGKRKKG